VSYIGDRKSFVSKRSMNKLKPMGDE